MTKNVAVFDDAGVFYGKTFDKRARGLVKKGRARRMSDTAIQLTCPPDILAEDNEMEDARNIVDDIMARIDAIIAQNDYIEKIVSSMQDCDVSDQKAAMMMQTVSERERTNINIIELLKTMYEQDVAKSKTDRQAFIENIAKKEIKCTGDEGVKHLMDLYRELFERI